MTTVFVHHHVRDYDTWRRHYDGFADFQASHGVTDKAVYRGVEDPLDLTVMHRFDSVERAQAFLSSQELRDTMAAAGVEGTPQIELYDEAD